MSKVIYLVAKKPRHKESFDDTLRYLSEKGLPIKPIDIEYGEYKGKLEVITSEGARQCSDILQSEVIVFRTGLFINALNDFPGESTNYVLKSIGLSGILKLMSNEDNRKAKWKFCLGYGCPEIEPKIFMGVCLGSIALKQQGGEGYAFDPIFVPDGHTKTFAEDPTLKDVFGARLVAINTFIKWYKRK